MARKKQPRPTVPIPIYVSPSDATFDLLLEQPELDPKGAAFTPIKYSDYEIEIPLPTPRGSADDQT